MGATQRAAVQARRRGLRSTRRRTCDIAARQLLAALVIPTCQVVAEPRYGPAPADAGACAASRPSAGGSRGLTSVGETPAKAAVYRLSRFSWARSRPGSAETYARKLGRAGTMAAVWNSGGGFRLPDGVRIVDQDSDGVRMSVSTPTDEHGFFGRQCPSCSQLFRIDSDDYEALPDDIDLWCVYCGHRDADSEFITDQQLERAKRAVGDWAVQSFGQRLDRSLRRLSTPAPRSGFGIKVSYRSTPFYPQALPGIDEERLIRIRRCAGCALRYAVFGEHRHCPACGPLPADVVALDALSAETARLDGLAQLPAEAAATLREQGVFSRIWVDTLENLVGVVETFAKAVFHAAVSDAVQRVKGKGNIFQRLDDAADLFVAAGYTDLRTALDAPTWQRLREVWATATCSPTTMAWWTTSTWRRCRIARPVTASG